MKFTIYLLLIISPTILFGQYDELIVPHLKEYQIKPFQTAKSKTGSGNSSKESALKTGKEFAEIAKYVKDSTAKAWLYYMAGDACWNWRFSTEAIIYFTNAIRYKNELDFYWKRADSKFKLNLFSSAVKDYEVLMKNNENYYLTDYDELTTCYINMGKWEKAIEKANRFVEVLKSNKPKYIMDNDLNYYLAESYGKIGVANYNLNNKTKACQYFNLTIDHAPEIGMKLSLKYKCN